MLIKFLSTTAIAMALSMAAQAQDLPAHQQLGRDILKQVVEIESDLGNTKAVAAILQSRFETAGFDVVKTIPFGDSVGFYARWNAKNPTAKPIGMIAHMDVVSAKRADWTMDPFTLNEDATFFYGRGTSDNKAGLTHIAASLLRLKAEGFEPNRDLVVFFSGDEETSMDTSLMFNTNYPDLMDVDYVLNSDAGGGLLIDGNGFSYGIQASEKMYVSFKVEVRNTGGHSSRPRKDNAIYELASALKNIEAYSFPVELNEVTRGFFSETAKLKSGQEAKDLKALAQGKATKASIARLSEDVAYNATMRTTCVATELFGGHAPNALPQLAEATVNCRILPGTDVKTVLGALQAAANTPTATVTQIDVEKPSPASPLRADVMNAVSALVHARYPNVTIVPDMSTGATDGVFYRNRNIPVYGVNALFSEMGESNAHGQNEKIRVKEFYDGLDQWHDLIKKLAQ